MFYSIILLYTFIDLLKTKLIDIHNFVVFRFVSADNLKRGLPASSSPTSAVLHTCVPFGVEHVEKTPEEVKPILMAELKRKFPEWPEPKQVKCQKWRYSQVSDLERKGIDLTGRSSKK